MLNLKIILTTFLLSYCYNTMALRTVRYNAGCSSKEGRYPVSLIPEALKKNADAVIRDYVMNVQIKSLNSLYIKVHRVVTVLRKSGIENALVELSYDKDSKVTSIHLVCYDQAGIEISHSKSSEIIDESAVPNGSFYSDDRVKRVIIDEDTYPFTVECDYEIDIHKLLHFPDWEPQDDYRLSVEHSELIVSADDNLLPRFKEVNLPQAAQITHDKNETIVTYTFQNLNAIEQEPYSIPRSERVPFVYIAPNEYRTLGNDFDFRTWKSYGQWNYSLIENRDNLPGNIRDQLLERIKDKKTKLEKIKEIYRFVQQNTRYVNTNIGIGGWQPVDAGTVAIKGYGDCKGLVNYTKALMSLAGITSYYTVTNADQEIQDIFPDFPSSQFNHIILCVPLEQDTIWLECTNQLMPFGYMGTSFVGRHVLIITPEGGVLVKTPDFPGKENSLCRKTVIDIDSIGDATLKVNAVYRGLQYEEVAGYENRSFKELADAFIDGLRTPSASVKKISYSFNKDRNPEAFENVDLSIRSLATRTGNRIFLPFNLFSNINTNLNQLSSRQSPLYFRFSTIDFDTVEIHIPHGYKVESLPETTEVTSQFGNYKVTTLQKDNTLTFCRVLEEKEGRYPPGSFADFMAYLQKIAHADKSNAVLIKN